ncbi:MAG: hypothetical protein ACOY16_12790 [Chloroflexota bacterium]
MDILPLLLIVGISLFVGIAVGYLLASLRHSPTEKPSQPPTQPLSDSTPSIPPPATAELPPVIAFPEEPPKKKGIVDLLADALQGERQTSGVSNKSIAFQVDEILQEKLQGTQLENRAIRVMELPGKGMVVMIGLQQYETVNDVPDPEIQAVLRSAVAEWESRSLADFR